jgi:hypothetical protein
MTPMDLKEIQDEVKKYFGVEIVAKESTKFDTPDSAMYLITDTNGNKYILRETDYSGGEDFEKIAIKNELGIDVAKWIKQINTENLSDEEKYARRQVFLGLVLP